VLQVTAWIPLLDANKENGCLQVLRGGHRLGRTCKHNCCTGGTWYVEVPPEEMASTLNIPVNETTVVTCEVPFGSVLFLNNLIPHKSTENYSQNIRWSLDLRW
jgi:ectoine hydroxylase-related dioxygenase (phytanoyl-CoA dioxygenase family)